MAVRTTSDDRRWGTAAGEDRRGGYPAGLKPATQLRPPPASIVKPSAQRPATPGR